MRIGLRLSYATFGKTGFVNMSIILTNYFKYGVLLHSMPNLYFISIFVQFSCFICSALTIMGILL